MSFNLPFTAVNDLGKIAATIHGRVDGLVVAIIELPGEQLDAHASVDDMEQHVDQQDVVHVKERVDEAVDEGLELGDLVDGFKRSEDAQDTQRFDKAQIGVGGCDGLHEVGKQRADDDDEIQDVPRLPDVRARM